jgi:predicted nucleic acid-binding protein
VGTVVIDSSVLIGFLDQNDVHHQSAFSAIAEHRQAGRTFTIPATVLAEILVSRARHDPTKVDRVRHLLNVMFGPARVIDEDVAVEAAHLRAQHKSLRLPDALVLATGVVDNAELVLTTDKRWSSMDQRVHVINS